MNLGNGALKDVRVLDFGHALAGPFAATLFADFGAEVIKIERPGAGDAMRDLGPKASTGPAWWKSMGRGKRCLALDWKNAKARVVLERLVRQAHVFVESFRPGVLEKNNLGPDVLHGWNPDLVILRVSGYGQYGPYSGRPGFGKTAEALSGLCDLTGYPDGPPTHPGFPMGDMTTGLMGAYGVMLALYAIQRGDARGQVIDLPIYETPLRLIDYHVPVRTGTGKLPKRNGNRQPLSFALSGVYKAKDGRWVTYSAATFSIAQRVLNLIGVDALANDPELTSLQAICEFDDEIDKAMKSWIGARTSSTAIEEFKKAQAAAEAIYDVDDILKDPHIEVRRNIVTFEGEPCSVVNVVPSLSQTPGKVRWLGREVGEDTIEILRDSLGFSRAEIDDLLRSRAVALPPEKDQQVPVEANS